MEGEILSIETTKKIARLETEKEMLRKLVNSSQQEIRKLKEDNDRIKDNFDSKVKRVTDYTSRIKKIIKLTEPFVEWEECVINGKILKRIYDIAKGGDKDE